MAFSQTHNAKHGLGYCSHLQLGLLFGTLVKRTLRLGHFSSKPPVKDRSAKADTTEPAATDMQKPPGSMHSPKEVPIEAIDRVAEKYFPEKNRFTNDNFRCAPHQLAYFGIDSERKLGELLDEQIRFVLAEDAATAKESLEPYREQRESEGYEAASAEMKTMIDASIERIENGVFHSWSGLLLLALKGRYGEAATDEYVDNYIFPKTPKSNAARPN